jgi:hypothetical protein
VAWGGRRYKSRSSAALREAQLLQQRVYVHDLERRHLARFAVSEQERRRFRVERLDLYLRPLG